MPDQVERVVMGRVAAPYAVKGWIKVQPFTEYPDSLLDYDRWWLGHEEGRNKGWREYRVLEGKVHGQTLLVQLEGVDDRTASEALKGLDVAVDRAEFPEPDEDEYYWDDLIGLDVVNTEGVVLGKVASLLETGAHDVLRVVDANEGERERLIPFVDAFVREVDRESRRILVEWGADWDKD
ncbi:MAG: ribosome maturation factor RimM [Thiobacillus sp.]|nr:ribosome maturation factor RimM [Thiobacillus sp.]